MAAGFRTEPARRGATVLGDVASILRLHIVLIAMVAEVVFGWLLTDERHLVVAVVGGLDWLLINLLNRVTDQEEDLANAIPGTARIAGRERLVLAGWVALLLGSFLWSHHVHPELTPYRVAVQLVGVGYSYRVVPTPRGWRRIKDLYFLKNFMSAMLFVATCFVYPLAHVGFRVAHPGGAAAVLVLIGFFVPFELTYEILYDMRDLDGDRQAGVPTYPVVHGLHRSRQIIDGLLLGSSAALALGFGFGAIGVGEALMLAAPLVQLTFYRPRYRRGLTTSDCIWLTHLGSALLLFFLAGTSVWEEAGLPRHVNPVADGP